MNKYLTLSTSAVMLSGLFLFTGCSSSSDDGGTPVASVPANAIVIDETNAETTVQAAVGSATTLGSVFSVETTQVLSLKSALNTITPILKNISTIDVATGTDFSEDCTGGGTVSGSSTETDDGTTYSESGTVSFNNCIEQGFTINGTVTYSSSGNYVTGAYTDNFSGSLTMTFNSGSDSFNFSNFAFAETGNYSNYTYTISQLTDAIDFVINGTQGGGFLVTLIAPIVESDGNYCPESGHIKVTGGNDTTAEGIYNGDGTMTIIANGTVVRTDAPCYN
jgi:hypothetical protein